MTEHAIPPSSVVLHRAADPAPEGNGPRAAAVAAVMAWAREYLCRPHPQLGRRGPVCPYVPASLNSGRFHVASYTGPGEVTHVRRALEECRTILLDETFTPARTTGTDSGATATHTTVLLTFPDLTTNTACRLVEETQRAAKTQLVRQQLMIGEFHPGPPPAPGLHNPAFRPLNCPVPLLALRHMMAADEPFLRDDPSHAEAYHRHFPNPAAPARPNHAGALL